MLQLFSCALAIVGYEFYKGENHIFGNDQRFMNSLYFFCMMAVLECFGWPINGDYASTVIIIGLIGSYFNPLAVVTLFTTVGSVLEIYYRPILIANVLNDFELDGFNGTNCENATSMMKSLFAYSTFPNTTSENY